MLEGKRRRVHRSAALALATDASQQIQGTNYPKYWNEKREKRIFLSGTKIYPVFFRFRADF